jgi:hypothetical protein
LIAYGIRESEEVSDPTSADTADGYRRRKNPGEAAPENEGLFGSFWKNGCGLLESNVSF